MANVGVGLVLLAAGLGLRHAAAPDHVAAVSTWVRATDAPPGRATLHALKIGGGHAVGMAGIAALMLGVMHGLPPALSRTANQLAGAWLVGLTLWMLGDLARALLGRRPARFEQPLWKPAARLGASGRRWLRHPLAAWLVGLLFGLAVSPGDLAIFSLVASQAGQPWLGAALLAVFLAAMLAALAALGALLGRRRHPRAAAWHPWLSGASGLFGLGVGMALILGWLH